MPVIFELNGKLPSSFHKNQILHVYEGEYLIEKLSDVKYIGRCMQLNDNSCRIYNITKSMKSTPQSLI